jgi:TPR repeat protein
MIPVLAIVLTAVLGVTGLADGAPRGEVYRNAKSATALILAVNDGAQRVSLGSGFFVNADGVLLTNAHVIEDYTRLFVYVQDQAVYTAPTVVAVDHDLDLAALRIPETGVASLSLGTGVPTEGTEVIAVGYPRASDLLDAGFVLHSAIVTGTVSGMVRHQSPAKDYGTTLILVTGVMNSGNSGGPLVLTDSGEVAGMVVTAVPYLEAAKDREGAVIGGVKLKSGLSYSIPAPTIRRWLTEKGLGAELRPMPSFSRRLRPSGVDAEAHRSFITGHLLHTMATVLRADSDLLGLAIGHYKAAAADRPTMPSLYRNLGLAYGSLGRWEEAVQAFQKALAQTPDDPVLLTDIGLAYQKLGQRERAIELYQTALELNPRMSLAHNNLGTLYWERNRLEDAILEYRLALESEPTSALAAYNLGSALEVKGFRKEATQAWESFLQRHQGVPDPDGVIGKMREGLTRLRTLPVTSGLPQK